MAGSDERHSSDSKILAFRIHLQHETLPKRSLAMSKSSAGIHSKIEFFTCLYLCICSIFEAFKVASAEHVTSCHKHHPILQTIFRNSSFLIFPSTDLSYPSDMDYLFLIYLPSLSRPFCRVSKALLITTHASLIKRLQPCYTIFYVRVQKRLFLEFH